jgi:hypothetical protein
MQTIWWFSKKINNQGKENFEKQPIKKRANIFNSSISKFFASKEPFKKDDVEPMFVENLALLIMKNNLLLQFVKSVWLKHLMLQLCPWVQFPSQKIISHNVLPNLVEKFKQTYVFPLLNKCYCVTVSVDL